MERADSRIWRRAHGCGSLNVPRRLSGNSFLGLFCTRNYLILQKPNLVKLSFRTASELIQLPKRRGSSSNGFRNRTPPFVAHATDSIRCALRDLRPLAVSIVEPESADLRLFNCEGGLATLPTGDLDRFHKRYRRIVGEFYNL